MQDVDERRRSCQSLGELCDFLNRLEQKTVFSEERPATEVINGMEEVRMTLQSFHQLSAGRGDQLRRWGIDHYQSRDEVSGKLLFERGIALPPRQIGRNKLVDVSIYREMRGRIGS